MREEASHITSAVSRIAEMTDQVSEGADAQIRSLDSALSGLNEMTASLKETADAGWIGDHLDRESGLLDQRDGGVDRTGHQEFGERDRTRPADGVGDSARATNRSRRLTTTAKDMATAAQQVTTSMTEITATVQVDDR